MPNPLPVLNADLHEEAERILAERNRARGRAADDYSADEYVDAVNAAEPWAALREAMKRLGDPYPGDEVVTVNDLYVRVGEILRERFGFPFETGKQPSYDAQVDAYIQAIKELGKPGEQRKDLGQLQAARRDEVIDRAVNEGRVLASAARWWRELWDGNSELAADMLAKTKPHPDWITSGTDSGNIHPDPEGFELHVAALAILEAAGVGKDYDAEQLVQAMTHITKASEAAPDVGPMVLASEIIERTGSHPSPGWFLEYAGNAVQAIVREAEELAAQG